MENIDNDYKLIPMSEITDEAREIAVRWGENMKDNFISQKHKLASDIMNYARRTYQELNIQELRKIRTALIEAQKKYEYCMIDGTDANVLKYLFNHAILDEYNIDLN